MKYFHKHAFLISIFLIIFSSINQSRAFEKREKRQLKDVEAIRQEIFKSQQNVVTRKLSTERLAEINSIKVNIMNSSAVPFQLSSSLTNMLKESAKNSSNNPTLGMVVEEAISDPNINIIDEHVKEIVNPNVLDSFQPNLEEIKVLAKMKHTESNTNNLYRENLQINVIREEKDFRLGKNVEVWKTLNIERTVALIGKTNSNTIVINIGAENSYTQLVEFNIEETNASACIEAFNIWDNTLNKVRNIILIGVNGNIIWYELQGEQNEIAEIQRWRLMKHIDKIKYIQHDGSDLLMLSTVDEAQKNEISFIEFNFHQEEFWVVQSFKLSKLPQSMTFVEAGKDLIVAFTQESFVSIYRHQNTKYERAKFSFLKNVDAANVSAIVGFRIGGHSYLAIGGDQPQILRYTNNDFHPQTILSQTFGFVEEFLAVPIKIYRDDLVLLVQHSIKFRTHNLKAVDALIWNGIAFESALSVPCKIAADPSANGFTCILDYEREEGLLGASFVVTEKNNSFFIVIPRHEDHSGLFKVEYEITEAEDPLLKEIESVKTAIKLINGMLDLEMSVKQQVDEALGLVYNSKSHFNFEGIELDEIDADIVHFSGNVTLESEKIEFLDMSYSRDDFIIDLDEMERILHDDEKKVREIDAHLNKLIRKHRQVPAIVNTDVQDTPIHYLGPYALNGQFDIKTLRVLPHESLSKQNRQKREIEPIDDSRVNEFKSDNLNVKYINGIPIEEFIFLDENGALNLPDKSIVFQESIHVDNVIMKNNGKVNGIDFSHEVLAINSPNIPRHLSFDKVIVDYLNIEKLNNVSVDLDSLQNITTNFGEEINTILTKEAQMHQNLQIKTINGVNWDEMISQIVLINKQSVIDNLTVNGNVIFIDYASGLNINTLNGLEFPNDYVLKTGPTETLISGIKTFTKKLVTKVVDTDGTINGVDPLTIITLDQLQEIHGEVTFSSIEVSQQLEVHGTVSGRKLEEFLPNPTLEDSKEILASCNFKELIVLGPIKIGNSLNGQNIRATLADVVYEDETSNEVTITGTKIFKNLKIDQEMSTFSNYINDVPINSIMTTVDDQDLLIDKLFGHVYFSNLKIYGLFDGVNATDLEVNSIRTFGDQFIQTPLQIYNHLSAKSIDIKNSVNDVSVRDYYFIDEPIVFPSQAKVGIYQLEVDNMKVSHDIVGVGIFASLNFHDLDGNYLSRSLQQNIVHPFKIDKLIVENMFDGNFINGMEFAIFKEYMFNLRNFKTNLLSGRHKLKSLIIDGNIYVRYINEKDFEFIKNHAIWLNKANSVEASLQFMDECEVHEKLIIEKLLNGKNLKHFMENWISRNEDPIVLSSDKIIQKAVIVEENLSVAEINNIACDNILRNDSDVESKFLNIIGTVNVENLNITNRFNREKVDAFTTVYMYDTAKNTLTINSDMKFVQNVQIHELYTKGFNDINATFWINDLIKVNDGYVNVRSIKTFEKPIFAEQGVFMDTFNHINIKELMDNIVIIKNNEIVNIKSNIHMLDDFYAELVGLKGNLTTDFIDGLDLNQLVFSAMPTHKDIEYNGALYFDSGFVQFENLRVATINGISVNDMLTLHTNQTFENKVLVDKLIDIEKLLIVNEFVNQMNLTSERENTIMINEENQEVRTNVVLSDALVLNSVTSKGLVNSKNVTTIALLNSSSIFNTSLTFKHIQTDSLYTHYPISNYNFTKIYDNALWKTGKEVQHIFGKWKLDTVYMHNDIHGNGLINGQPVNEIEQNLNRNVNEIEMALSNYSVEYRSMCEKLQYRAESYGKDSIYLLKYFDNAFEITEDVDIFSYYTFETKNLETYLFVNRNCTTNIYKWQRSEEQFRKLDTVVTGVVYSWKHLELENTAYIVTMSKMVAGAPCHFGGTSLWTFVDNTLIHDKHISRNADVLEIFVHSLNSKSFFVLNNADKVENYDTNGNKLEEWNLPYDNYTYSFVPADILPGLNINNGRRIFSLDTKFLKGRRQRSVGQAPILEISRNKVHKDDSPTYTIRKPEIPQNYAIPTIPSKTVKTTKRIDFMSKVKDAGDVIRRSFNLQSAYISENGTKFGSFSGGDKSRLLFAIKTPNVTALHERLVRNRFVKTKEVEIVKDTNESNHMLNKMEEIQKKFQNTIDGYNATEKISDSETEVAAKSEEPMKIAINIGDSEEEDGKLALENGLSNNSTNVLLKSEPVIDSVTVVGGKGIRDTENYIIPEHSQGEIISLIVGTEKSKKQLYAIARRRNSVIQGNNVIEIFSDIISGEVFQYIVCTNPSHIQALRYRDETLLAFLESRQEVKVYIYRGIQGFTLFKSISLAENAYHMSSVTLPTKILYKCDQRYLVFHLERKLLFMNVVVDGNCGLDHIKCDGF